jgi:hypothetical protein
MIRQPAFPAALRADIARAGSRAASVVADGLVTGLLATALLWELSYSVCSRKPHLARKGTDG